MTEETQVAKREGRDVRSAGPKVAETIYVPAVDIREDGESMRLLADMPGVAQNAVEVTVENGVLTIEGRAGTDAPEGYELVGQEYDTGRYRRDFTLSNEVSVEGINGRMKNGLLEVTIPKREEVKTRKIEVTN